MNVSGVVNRLERRWRMEIRRSGRLCRRPDTVRINTGQPRPGRPIGPTELRYLGRLSCRMMARGGNSWKASARDSGVRYSPGYAILGRDTNAIRYPRKYVFSSFLHSIRLYRSLQCVEAGQARTQGVFQGHTTARQICPVCREVSI